MELWRLIAHRHWFSLRILGREFRFCSRCSGYLTSLLILTALTSIIGVNLLSLIREDLKVILSLLSVIPLSYDWLTQSWALRESNNKIRFATGIVMGFGVYTFSSINSSPNLKTSIYIISAAIISLIGVMGIKKREVIN
ncbi:MAG: DUF2085 domain-containing protein [Candidatus Bathyarchaeia archaeon]